MADRLELSRDHQDYLKSRHRLPQPRNALSEALRTYAPAAMAVSDGLVGDLAKLCRASRVAAHVDVWSVPLSDAAQAAYCKEPSLIVTILTGGDDHEIVATLPPDTVAPLRDAALPAGIAVTEIGRVVMGEGIARFVDQSGEMLTFANPSFSHL